MKKSTGDIFQTPPMVSAVKVNGVPLYKSARKGKTVERKPKLIHVYEFKLVDFSPPDAKFFLRCTKGTYVRTLCSDIGDILECGAHLAELRRTQCGDFNIENTIAFDDILKLSRDKLVAKIIPLEKLPTYRT
jgi:tRNA pseudouridine55 synthase